MQWHFDTLVNEVLHHAQNQRIKVFEYFVYRGRVQIESRVGKTLSLVGYLIKAFHKNYYIAEVLSETEVTFGNLASPSAISTYLGYFHMDIHFVSSVTCFSDKLAFIYVAAP